MIVTDSLKHLTEDTNTHRVVVACGVFDGVHLGHQQIIQSLLSLSKKTNSKAVVMTFSPHPRKVVTGKTPPLLTCREHQLRIFKDMGIDAVIIIPFNKEIAALSADDFLDLELLVDNIELKGICVGSNWRFGARDEGTVQHLKKWGKAHNFHVISVPELDIDNEEVSSTRIRAAIQKGDLKTAEKLFGKPFSVFGEIKHGRGIGNDQLHCPTANLVIPNVLLPPPGVYAGHVTLKENEFQDVKQNKNDAILYVGTAPSFNNAHEKPILECHIFNFDHDIYGMPVEVHFTAFIRKDKKFDSTEKLAEQIQKDINTAKNILKTE